MLTLILAILIAAALKSRSLLRTAFDGRHSQTEEEAAISRFDMKPEMTREQTKPRISGWLSVLSPEDVAVRSERGMLRGQVFPPLSGDTDAPWAILFHGGAGTDGSQMLDVACELSLAGYRVLVPDLYAHGNSDGGLSSLGAADAQDVLTWVDWVLGEKPDARVVLMGQDEGALAVLLAQEKGLPQAVAAVAAESRRWIFPKSPGKRWRTQGRASVRWRKCCLVRRIVWRSEKGSNGYPKNGLRAAACRRCFSRVRWMSSRLLMSRRISPLRWAVGQRSA